MTSNAPNLQLVGFEKDAGLKSLLTQFGVFQDYRAALPEHLLGILRQQHPNVVIESIELLDVPKCKLGGMQDEQSKTIIRVQTLDVPLNLSLTIRVGVDRFALDIQLVIICEGLDSTPTTRSDMFVRSQRAIT
ncbi:MAG TPA: hypothetical protein VI136_03530 [Verrucomicrobiae bacterium]